MGELSQATKGISTSIALFLLLLFLLSGCTSLTKNSSNFADNKYYQGYQGVEMQFSQSLPPSRMYFYGDSQDNTFNVNVQVSNKGSAWSRGGIFVSGYDPMMIDIEGITPDASSSKACRIDIGNIGFGAFGGTLRCGNDLQIGLGGDYTQINLNNLFCQDGKYLGKLDTSKLFGSLGCTDFSYKNNNGKQTWSIDFGNAGIDADYANHGRLLISMLQSVDFSRTFGLEYLLAGNNYDYPGGEVQYLNFKGNIITWPAGLDMTEQTFLITNCYLYATYAAPITCIDPSPFSESMKVCTPKTYTGTSGQGAPVAVTYIEQENTARQAIFTIHIKNTGGGRVYDPGALEICSPYSPVRVTENELNKVYVGDIRVSGDLQRLECNPNDFVRLDPKTGEGIVTCVYDIPFSGLKSAYQAPLVVELWYGYEKTIQKKVTIKRAI
jgi:hypothetical protein